MNERECIVWQPACEHCHMNYASHNVCLDCGKTGPQHQEEEKPASDNNNNNNPAVNQPESVLNLSPEMAYTVLTFLVKSGLSSQRNVSRVEKMQKSIKAPKCYVALIMKIYFNRVGKYVLIANKRGVTICLRTERHVVKIAVVLSITRLEPENAITANTIIHCLVPIPIANAH